MFEVIVVVGAVKVEGIASDCDCVRKFIAFVAVIAERVSADCP